MATALDDMSNDGKFVRKDSQFRDWVKEGGKFEPQAKRYSLYVSLACPWATRTLAFRAMKGLEDAIDVYSVHPTWKRTRPNDPNDTHSGWVFADPEKDDFVDDQGNARSSQDCTASNIEGVESIRDLYDLAVGGKYPNKFTTPILWDSKEKTIVNNESSEICRMLNSNFNALAKNEGLDLYPEANMDKIRELEHWIYHDVNNGVYKSGFAQSQSAYDEAVGTLFKALDKIEELLKHHRYLAGSEITGIDIWLFMTLIRFDAVYVIYFKCSKKCLREYHNIFNYLKDLYQVPEIGGTVNMFHIRTHYFTSHPKLNPYQIVTTMPDVDYSEPHDRDRKYS